MRETDAWRFIEAKFFTKCESRRSVRLIVIHSAETLERNDTAENVAHYFQTLDRPASAHLCIDADSIVQCVRDNDVAFAAPGANHDGIHIELAGKAAQTESEWLDEYGRDLLENAADAVAQYCLKYDLPVKHLNNLELKQGQPGIVGHMQVSVVYRKSTHLDPGQGFPWEYFIALIQSKRNEILRQDMSEETQ